MGCYEGLSLQNVNAMLARITGVREGMVLLQTDTVSVVIYNTGYTALTSVNLEWSINGISQNTGGTNYPVSLVSRGDFTTISIGQITYPAGNVDIKVWINNINGNAIMDEYANDDTVNKSIYICDGGINGLITIGSSIGSDFKTIKEFQSALSLCGVSGDINLVLEPGIYRENLDLSNNTVLMGNSTLTITSSTDNANDVIIRPVAGWGVLLAYSKNIVLKALTIDAATNGTNAIEFTGTCTNIVVRDCRLLADTTAITNSFNAVSKQQNTGFVENISFIHNLLDGGYYGFVFYGGTGTGTGGYGTNVVFDSNTVSNQYLYSIYLSFIDSLSCSYNTILSRTENINVTWYGIYMNNNNGNVIANRIKQRSDAITNPYGIYVQSHNYYPIEKVQGKGLVANNEIILNTTGAFYGIYANTYTKAKIIHNSIYISGAGIARGIQIMNSAYNDMVIKNNNIFMKDTAAIPIYFSATGNLSVYTIDYNNYYAPNYIGFYGENKTSLTDWRTSINNADLHSVRILPDFINPSINLDLATYDNSLLCPKAEIRTDIDGLIRDNTTTMGAYMDIPAGRDLMLTAVSSWNSEAIINQTVSVYVDVLNAAAIPITGATFGWSVNGVSKTPVPWTTSQALNLMEKRNVSIGTFRVTNTDTFNIKVWVETVNGQPETATWNDTVSAQSVMLPLVEFIVPETDTLGTLSFDVLAKIRSFTGAPTTPPILYMEATHKDAYFFYDSIPMIQNGDIWQATIPQQYYGSKVIYSLTVSDAIGNTMDLRDSVSIAMYFNKISDYIYYASADTSGGVSNTASVLSGTRLNSWSRHLYLNSELENINPLMETYIASIAFKLNVAITTAGVDRTDVRIYMAATTSTMQPATYLDPVINGATLVYQGPMIMQYPGWIELAFSKSFTLPVGSNLMVYIEDYTPITGSFTWKAKTATVGSVSGYPIGTYDAIPTKPVTRFGLGIVDPYKGNNLGLLSLLSPVNDMDNLCGSDYSPVNVTMINLGENDYDFSKDSITLKLEVLYPQNTLYTVSLTLDSGIFESGAINILELEASLPIMYAGRYELKAWVESAIDNIFYDDTIYYTYISGRIGLPIDEDFSNGILSTDFITTPIVGSEAWTSNNNSTLPVQAINGTGILQYTGSRGNMTELTTRQIDLSGSVNPKLEFWYYHDATASDLDNSYTEVNIVADGVHNLALFLYRKGATTGWVKYTVPLNQYTFAQCVLVQFVSMNKYDEHSAQYIDRIIITSEPDLAVSEIIISPEISVCDLKNKTMSVVLRTVTNQTIDLSNYTTNLSVEIPGHSTYTVPLQQIIAGNTSDTVLVTQNMNIDTGNYNIKAYLIPPVDNNPANDNMSYAVDIRPGLSVTVSSLTGGINCFKIGSQVQQEVRIQNTGNVDLPGIEFLLRIRGNSTDTIIKEIGSLDLPAGKDTSYIFTSTYTVPAEATYQVQVTAWMGCDSVLVNSSHAAEECADIHDLSIVSLDSPPTGQTDVAGSMQTISVTVENTDDHYPFTDVVIIASIENEQ
jgi:hypothetical protein